eukprot:98097_1
MSSKKSQKGDAKYFTTTKKGEIHELRSDLNSLDKNKVKDAIKKVIAAMTVGKDVSMLFADVIKSMGTENIELKKLVYLYIINYARSQPEKAILVVNTFQKDARIHPNPLVRALAIRTMGCIRVDRITEYLCDPLASALTDKDPYVRKTAAVCVAKLYDINSELVEERGFVERLRNLISDPNPMVVANAVAALTEISELSGKDKFGINSSTRQKLLTALNECTEWGQVFILDALAKYEPSPKDAESIAERVAARLQHANSAVVMSAVKVIMNYLDVIEDQSLVRTLSRKLAPPLVTLLSSKPEIQYIALRNIFLIVQRRPEILQNEVRVFFCKYNDAPYVKLEKLEILIKLASDKNVDQVLMEFKEYAQEVDIDFVRKAVSAVGRVAIKLDSTADRCVNVLLDLIRLKVDYVVQEAVIVIKDIFRRYPNRFERVIVDLCENLETLDEPEAKASMIWIVGEYAERIDDAPERLEFFMESFNDESALVQLQLLTATVKLFLKRPDGTQDLVKKVLELATENTDNPDLRDRGYVYWRLLSADPAVAKEVVLTEKPVISDDTFLFERPLLDSLIANIGSLASVYHKPPEQFVKSGHATKFTAGGEQDLKEESEGSDTSTSESSEDESGSETEESSEESESDDTEDSEERGVNEIAEPQDLLGLSAGFGVGPAPSNNVNSTPSKVILTHDKGSGVQISVQYTRRNGSPYMDLTMSNRSQKTLRQVAIKFNKNFLGIANAEPMRFSQPIGPGSTGVVQLKLKSSGSYAPPSQAASTNVQIAMKTEVNVLYFQDSFPVEIFLSDDGKLDNQQFLTLWKNISSDQEVTHGMVGLNDSVEGIMKFLEKNNCFLIARRNVQGRAVCYFSASLRDVAILLELKFSADESECDACVKSSDTYLSDVVVNCVKKLLCTPEF